MATTVLIVDDHTAFRSRVRRMLEADGFEVVGEAADGLSGVDAARRLEPDVVLLDLQLPDTTGFAVAEEIMSAQQHLVGLALTLRLARRRVHIDAGFAAALLDEAIEDLATAGVGYLLKDRVVEIERFTDAIRQVADGGSVLDPEVVSHMLGQRGPSSA